MDFWVLVLSCLVCLGIISAGLLFSFLAWVAALADSYSRIGPRPLLFGYSVFIAAVLATFLIINLSNVATQANASLFFSYILWVLYTFNSLSGYALLPLVLIVVPVAALLARNNRLNYPAVLVLLVVGFLMGAALFGQITNNRPFNIAYVLDVLGEPTMLFVPPYGLFLLSVVFARRRWAPTISKFD